MADGDKKSVFISYCTKNSELAQFLCNQLEGSGVACWIAPRDIPAAGEWAGAIVEGLDKAKVVALLVSEASMASKEVAKEIDLANSSKVTEIVPIRIENATLQGAFRYHLSSKQWVDAYGDDKTTRFAGAIANIRGMLNKESAENHVAEGSVLGKARILVAQLNEKHSKELNAINAMFSLREEGPDCVILFFPLRIGAYGVDLILKFHGPSTTMEFYADAASDGDWLKTPFIELINKQCADHFPNPKVLKGARRWRFIELIPKTDLTSPLIKLLPEAAFEIFKQIVVAFSDDVLPKILAWAEYAAQIRSATHKVEEELKILFPEQEGWRVGAPEGWRLDGFRPNGKISVYKTDWVPKEDDYRGRGLLSITLECSGAFLNNLYIGVLKYEDWMDLGDWEDRIAKEADKLAGQSGKPESFWPWWQKLDDGFNNSGIGEAELFWKDKLDDFVQHCLDKFKTLKSLAGLLDQACEDMTSKPIQQPDCFVERDRKWENGLYIQNWLRKIASDSTAIINEKDLTTDYRYRKNEEIQDVRLRLKVGNFDAAVAFRCGKNEWRVAITNLEPPDFETPIIKDFFDKRCAEIKFEDISKLLLKRQYFEKAFDGSEVDQWMVRFQTFVSDSMAEIIPAIRKLKSHLEQVVDLTSYAEKELGTILTKEGEWEIENKANTLERSSALTIYHTSWRSKASQEAYPPLIVQIVPESPCFDDLSLAVKLLGAASPALERKLGAVCGACDFAFGKADNQSASALWQKKFDEAYNKTGGMWFEKRLLDGEGKKAFGDYLHGIAEKLKQMEPIIGEACQKQNELDFIAGFEQFVDRMASSLQAHFPEKEGWVMQIDAKNRKSWGTIRFFKKDWQKPGMAKGALNFTVCGGQTYFDNLYIGIEKSIDKYSLSQEREADICKQLPELPLLIGNPNKWWLGCRHADKPHNSTGVAERKLKSGDELQAMLKYYSDLFGKMKALTPEIEKLLSGEKKTDEPLPLAKETVAQGT
jgi:hypothetical protein